MSLQQLNNDVAVVTGATSEVGRAIARAFAEQGARIALIAIDVAGLEAVQSELRERGSEVMLFPLEITDSKALDEAADRISAAWGPIDIWINQATISVYARVTRRSAEEYRRPLRVNYLDHVHGTHAALRHMRQRNRGLILQIGSTLAYRSMPLRSAYSASKAALRGFTGSLQSELIREGSGIAVAMLCLPSVSTPQPEVIAQATVYAALHSKRELWLGSRGARPSPVKAAAPGSIAVARGGLGRARRRGASPKAIRSTPQAGSIVRTHPVVFALLGLSAAALAFGPLRRWGREHARFLDRRR